MDKSLSWHIQLCVLVIIAILCFPACLHSSDSLHFDITSPELIELYYENLELETWLPDDTGFPDSKILPNLKIKTAHNWRPSGQRLAGRVLISPATPGSATNPLLHATLYQKLEQGEKPVNLARIALMLSSKTRLKTLALGSFRLQAGEGLVLGAYNPASGRQSRFIHPVYSLSHPALTGFAAEFNLGGIDWVTWLSQTQRTAGLDQGKITRLYESSLTLADNRGRAAESTGGVIAEYRRKHLRFGGYVYRQGYDRAFADTTFSPLQDACGLFAGYEDQPVTLGFETAFTGEKIARSLTVKHKGRTINHALRYIYRPEANPLSYARTNQLFGQKTGSEELSWDVRYRFLPQWLFISRIAAVRDLTGRTDSGWKERLIFSVNHSGEGWQSGLTYYRFQKDAIPFQDTLSAEILPTQHRFKAYWAKDITNNLAFKSTCQYQHYLDQKVTRNGFSLQQSFNYSFDKTYISASFTAWTNQKSLYQPVELPTEDELLVMADSDSALRIILHRMIHGSISLSINAYRPLRRISRQSFGLNLQAQI